MYSHEQELNPATYLFRTHSVMLRLHPRKLRKSLGWRVERVVAEKEESGAMQEIHYSG